MLYTQSLREERRRAHGHWNEEETPTATLSSMEAHTEPPSLYAGYWPKVFPEEHDEFVVSGVEPHLGLIHSGCSVDIS